MWNLKDVDGKVDLFCLSLSSICSVISCKFAVRSDEDKGFLPRSIHNHNFYKVTRELSVCLMESEGVSGPKDNASGSTHTVWS